MPLELCRYSIQLREIILVYSFGKYFLSRRYLYYIIINSCWENKQQTTVIVNSVIESRSSLGTQFYQLRILHALSMMLQCKIFTSDNPSQPELMPV